MRQRRRPRQALAGRRSRQGALRGYGAGEADHGAGAGIPRRQTHRRSNRRRPGRLQPHHHRERAQGGGAAPAQAAAWEADALAGAHACDYDGGFIRAPGLDRRLLSVGEDGGAGGRASGGPTRAGIEPRRRHGRLPARAVLALVHWDEGAEFIASARVGFVGAHRRRGGSPPRRRVGALPRRVHRGLPRVRHADGVGAEELVEVSARARALACAGPGARAGKNRGRQRRRFEPAL